MTKWLARFVVVVGVLGAGAAQAQPVQNVVLRNSFNPVGAGARGLGMGGAFIAVADDGTAASFNPAGLAQLRRTELALVGFTDRLTSDIPGMDPDVIKHQKPDFFGLSIPFDVGGHALTLEVAYQRSVDLFGRGGASDRQLSVPDLEGVDPEVGFGANGEIPPEFVGGGTVDQGVAASQIGAFQTVSLAAGYQLTSRLSVGAALNYWIANWNTTGGNSFTARGFDIDPATGKPRSDTQSLQRQYEQDHSMRAVNLNFGMLLKFPRVSLGGVLRLPFSGDYQLNEKGGGTFRDRAIPDGAALDPSETNFQSKGRLHWPRSAGVGIALRPFRRLTLAGDYSRSQWSRTYFEDLPNGALLTPAVRDSTGTRLDTFSNRNFFDLAAQAQSTTVDTSQWRAGGEYLIVVGKAIFPLRGGLFRDRSPIAELTTNEGRRIKGVTAGTGINFSHIVLDVAFEHRTSEGVVGIRFNRKTASASTTSEKVTENRVVASLIYRFGEDDPIKRALRYLFVGPHEQEGN